MINIVIPIFWVALSLMIGLLGRKKFFGFWGFFLCSLVLTPIVGFLMLIFFEVIAVTGEAKDS
jgi:hypothetical protein